ncbi:hypothetical protein RhiirA1_483686 [Rhizophagus irregularis]|uniref:Uncharacterized protein n=1 Tax=Rhizophagus irregularis TaxID=588596 RepID=A0A2I1FKU7_9GLOM|nr:hypothetical protein RhiirA1_483686 [Rhizophagus irregularis]PKY35000.1 hypothetical protein RhiirB3_455272 [Rhizophagus irregularis]GBC29869.2 ribonuclease H-like domain-containing protein [Rhizophagus irregularis DAOM 181602=DAOM 197198]
MTGKRKIKLDIAQLKSMVQLHSYYITNAKSELRFSSSNMNVDELETEIQKVITAMINNNDLSNVFCLFISPTIPPVVTN